MDIYKSLNPAILMLIPGKDDPTFTYSEVLTISLNVPLDFSEEPLANADEIWFTDESRYIAEGKSKAGHAATSLHGIVEVQALP